jgi:glycosyltransferase involved in cell wall biosynthesis
LLAYEWSTRLKIDIVSWTLNGERTLGAVLNRANQVFPKSVVNRKFIVDDGSTDNTVAIAKKYGWEVLQNKGKGISDGANTALENIRSPYFVSIEQDVLLPKDWWKKLSVQIISLENMFAASGICLVDKANFCSGIEQYMFIMRNTQNHGGYGKMLGNTIWNTEMLTKIGGFPKLKHAGQDVILWGISEKHKLKWVVDFDLICNHLHSGTLKDEFRRTLFYGISTPQMVKRLGSHTIVFSDETLLMFLKRFAKSPISSVRIVAKIHDPRVFVAFPATRLAWLLGYIQGRSNQ